MLRVFAMRQGWFLFARFSPIRQLSASQDHSGTGIGNRRNGTDHLPLRAPEDGSAAGLKRDLRGQRARECFDNCVEIVPLSNLSLPETASPSESFCCIPNDNRSSGRVLAFLSKR